MTLAAPGTAAPASSGLSACSIGFPSWSLSQRISATRKALLEAQATTVDMAAMGAVASRLDVWAELSVEEMKQVLRDVIH